MKVLIPAKDRIKTARQFKSKYPNKSTVWTILKNSGQSKKRSGMWLKGGAEGIWWEIDITMKIYTNMFQTDETRQPIHAINSTFFKQRKYMGNNNELHYGLKIRVNIKDFRKCKGQISKKILIGDV